METIVLIIHVLLAAAVIGLILIQQGKGAEAAKLAADIEADYPTERVRKLVESGGFDRD